MNEVLPGRELVKERSFSAFRKYCLFFEVES